MRKFSPYCTLLLFYCFLYLGNTKAQIQKIYLNPKAAGSAKQSQFIDSIRFIPLEIKKEVQFVSNPLIMITDKYFMIADYYNRVVLLYSRDGRFVKSISYKKTGFALPKYDENTEQLVFFGNNKNYALTPKDVIKIKLGWDNPGNKKYFERYVIDLKDSSFTLKKDVPTQNDILGSSSFYNNYYWLGEISTSPFYKDSLDYEIKIYQGNKLVKRYFPYSRVDEPKFLFTQEYVSLSKTPATNTHFIGRPYCDTIYKMVGDSLFPAYHIITPLENHLPPSFFITPFKNKDERENFRMNNGWMLHSAHILYETPSIVFFHVRYLYNYEKYIYLKQTGTTYKAKNIRAESSQYNLNLLASTNIFSKGEWFYNAQKVSDLISFFENNKEIQVPKELESLIKNNPSSDAQVLVAFKFKN